MTHVSTTLSEPDPGVSRNSGNRIVPLLCLVGAGTLLGLGTNLSKVAANIGLGPVAFLAWSAAGAALLLTAVAAVRGHLPARNGHTLRYALIAGLLSLAAPNLIAFAAAPRIGVPFVALTITLPPLLTYLGAVLLRMERFEPVRAVAILLALAGAAWIAVLKLGGPAPDRAWILAALAIPVFLAAGNLYRSLDWPSGAKPDALAPAMLGAAALLVIGVAPVASFDLAVPPRAGAWALIAVQSLAFAGQYLLFFILQRTGGPVYMSLMGAVAAITGIPAAIVILGEAAPEGLALGAILIAAGVALMTLRGARL
jgi:drug/metabolite transporter (DMT)-like permease